MPAWVLALLQYVLPVLLDDAVKAGAINEAQALSVNAVVGTEEFLGKLHVYYQYPPEVKSG